MKGGLLPLPEDNNDYQFGAIFELPRELPYEFSLEGGNIKDQIDTDTCTAHAVTTASELQEGIELDPLYQFAKTKQIMGEYEPWGADLRSACKSATKYGSIKKDSSPFNIRRDTRGSYADWLNWSPVYDAEAYRHAKETFFAVSGGKDTFDSIRNTIWSKKSAVVSGALWRASWNVEDGVIPEDYENEGYGHAFAILGWTVKNKVPYLVIQNSYGKTYGDNGYFYMSREVANRELRFGNFIFVDMVYAKAKLYASKGINISDSFWVKLWKIITS